MTEERTIQRRKLSDEVLERLLAKIESGDLPPGSQLPSERELMSRYAVGRPAVREAMQALERMGLISISHGERARVNTLEARDMLGQIDRTVRHMLSTSPASLAHMREARVMFEVGLVRRAAARAGSADLKRLREALEDQRSIEPDWQAFVKADMAFHNAIAEVSGNPIISALSAAMLEWLFEFHQELLRSPGHEDVTLAEHQAIYERIAAHDARGAAKAMEDHLMRASERYRMPEAGTA